LSSIEKIPNTGIFFLIMEENKRYHLSNPLGIMIVETGIGFENLLAYLNPYEDKKLQT
jgi:hypothetical protein